MFLSYGVPSWTYSELSVIVAGLTEYYVNENGEITLPRPVDMLVRKSHAKITLICFLVLAKKNCTYKYVRAF
jgi:hypothetical protein